MPVLTEAIPQRARFLRCKPYARRSHQGLYHTYRHPADASQYTARCPGAPPPLAAVAAGQSQIDQLTVIRPGPHSCPLAQSSG